MSNLPITRLCRQSSLSRELPRPSEFYRTPFGLAGIYAGVGRKDLGLDALEQAFERRDVQLREIKVEPAFERIRADSRFGKIVRRMNLK
jgi:hypothetical protein